MASDDDKQETDELSIRRCREEDIRCEYDNRDGTHGDDTIRLGSILPEAADVIFAGGAVCRLSSTIG